MHRRTSRPSGAAKSLLSDLVGLTRTVFCLPNSRLATSLRCKLNVFGVWSGHRDCSNCRRSQMGRHKGSIAIMVAWLLLTGVPAYAYVDPTTGGSLIQYATAGIAGIAILLRLYWRRLRDAVDHRPTDQPH